MSTTKQTPNPRLGSPTPAAAAMQQLLGNPTPAQAAMQQLLGNPTPGQAAMQQQLLGNPTPASLQPQHTNPTTGQPQRTPTHDLQPHMGNNHQIPADIQPLMVINRPRQPRLGRLQTPIDVPQQQLQPQLEPQPQQTAPIDSTQSQPVSKQALQNPRLRGDHRLMMFSTSDDNVMSKQIMATHAPDGREIDVKPLISVVEDIFKRAVPSVRALAGLDDEEASTDATEEKTYPSSFIGLLQILAYLIDRISCEITCKCSGGGDAHATAIAILNMLSSYPWDAKLAIALSAFGVNYGEFWLVAQSYSSNQLSKAVAILKQLPEILESTSTLKPQFDAIKKLIKAMLDISKCIVEYRELPSHYISSDNDALATATAHIPLAVYWTIRSILACSAQLTGLTLLGREHMVSTTEAWELSTLTQRLTDMHNHLKTQLALCYKHIDEKKHNEDYQNLVHLFETTHIDNMRVLKALIYQKDDLLPLVDGATKKRVHLEVLRRKNVSLLISDLDISQEELSILEQIYNEARQQATRHESLLYEVVWLPIVDPAIPWTDAKQQQFENLQANMPWYSVYHPSLIDRAVIRFTREQWHFQKKPILVVLDPHGRVVSPNALHMMWIWGSLAFPFTTAREEALWREESWRLELLVDGIDPVVLNWMSEGRYICLYGGEDMEWIRKFTNVAKAVAQAAGISLEMIYVGKSNPKERVRRNVATITAEKLSYCWQDLTSIWYFWVRLESMWQSKNQLGKTVENDHIMNEIMTMLSFDSSEGGWAVFARGSADMTKAKGGLILTCLQEYDRWKENARLNGFMPALQDHLQQLHTPHHCNRFLLPGTAGTIPEKVVCSECGRPMQKYIMYQCCDE